MATSTGLVVALPASFEAAKAHARELLAHDRPVNTQRAYAGAWKRFENWCRESGRESLPAAPDTVAVYLAHLDLAGRAPATIDIASAAISAVHIFNGLASPTTHVGVLATRRSIGLKRGRRPDRRRVKASISIDQMSAIIRAIKGGGRQQTRDRAILLVGFWSGLRRSNLVMIDIEHLTFHPMEGVEIEIPRSKTDQKGRGATIALPEAPEEFALLCPVRALRAWIKLRGSEKGPLFTNTIPGRSPTRLCFGHVNIIIKLRAADANIDPTPLGAHSLRASLSTHALTAVGVAATAMITGHSDGKTLQKYYRPQDRFAAHPMHAVLAGHRNPRADFGVGTGLRR